MKFRFFFLLSTVLCGYVSVAQQPRRYTAPLLGTTVLRDTFEKYDATVRSMELPEVEGELEQARLQKVKEASAKLFPRKHTKTANKTTAASMPVLASNFVADSLSGIPPDNYMAISVAKKAVSVINGTIAIHDALTGSYLYRRTLGNFSRAIGLNSFNDYRFDPKVIYDPEADRFICVMLNGINQYNYIVLGFSDTNDPAAAWHFYAFYGDYRHDTTWFDYPAISITKNEFFLTGNKIFYDSSWQAGFRRTLIYQVRKADGYAGAATLGYQIWDSVTYGGKFIRCLHPVKAGSSLAGPEQYFLSDRNFSTLNDTVFLVKVPDTMGGSGTLTITPVVSSVSYGVPPDGRQPDTAHTLATNDGRVLGGFLANNEIQLVSTSVNPVNGNAAIYHGVMRNVSTTPTLTGHIYSYDSLDLGYPNISYTGYSGGNNQSIISFNYSGPSTFPGLGATYFDGSNYSPMLNVKSGSASISRLAQKQQRWGDYSGSQVDWGMIGSVWAEGIFGANGGLYGCYMAQIYSPDFTSVPTLTRTQGARLFPNPAVEFVNFEFSLARRQKIAFAIYDLQGKLVDKLLTQLCNDGENIIEFNTAPLSPGTYFVKGVGEYGETIDAGKFIKK